MPSHAHALDRAARPLRPARARRPPTREDEEAGCDLRVRDLLVRLREEEHQAEDARDDLGDFLGWPSWSMDTGLTPAQETFVEHWSPGRVLDDVRSVRRLVQVLQRLRAEHEELAGLDEALAILAGLHPREADQDGPTSDQRP